MRDLVAGPRAYPVLLGVTLLFRILTAIPLQQAGYMDASYAIHVAENLARGRGFVEDVLWNYLDSPTDLPHPSNLYWMPLPSFQIAPFFVVFGVSYRVAQIPFILQSALLPLLAFHLGRRIYSRDDYAWAAGLFTAFSGFYTAYWISPDNFAVFGITASTCLFCAARGMENRSTSTFFAAGILAALSHLARADGFLLVAVVPISLLMLRSKFSSRSVLLATCAFFLGYLIVMSPWFIRNSLAVGAPYPSAGTKTLWLTNYDELFRLTDDLTPQRFLAWGVANILESKGLAALRNLFIITFADLQVFLAPFALIGLWQLRHRALMLPFLVYFVLLYVTMTLAFTFPSWHGSLFHSGTALLPFFAVAVPPGVDSVIRWIARRRRTWSVTQAALVFRVGFVSLAFLISVLVYAQAVFPLGGEGSDIPLWNSRDIEYPVVARWLDQNARPNDRVMVVDPPAFYNASHRSAIVIPTDGVEAVFRAAKLYGVRYLVLQFDHPVPLRELYRQQTTIPGLTRVADFRDGNDRPVWLFEVAQ